VLAIASLVAGEIDSAPRSDAGDPARPADDRIAHPKPPAPIIEGQAQAARQTRNKPESSTTVPGSETLQ